MSILNSQPLFLLNSLERFEKQSRELRRNELIELFCEQVIPFLEESSLIGELRKEWQTQQDRMSQRIQGVEEKALKEVKETFREVKAGIEKPSHPEVKERLKLIEELVSGKRKLCGAPLYQILYNNLKELIILLLNLGHVSLCREFAKLETRKIYEQKNLNQGDRWVRVFGDGHKPRVLNAEEMELLSKEEKDALLFLPPDYHLVDKTFIEEFSFAPAVIEAHTAMDAIRWNRLQHPAFVWWYFKGALWCWRTTEFYFDDIVRPKNSQDCEKHFETTCNKGAWHEIASAKEKNSEAKSPIIFTNNLFRTGLHTLTNAISMYFSEGSTLKASHLETSEQLPTIFELILDGNELWVGATFENEVAERFYIQKFHEGINGEVSKLHQFVKDIVNNPEPGEKQAKLKYKWESAAKHINRIQLPKFLKEKFFLKSHGSHFQFGGVRIGVLHENKDEIVSTFCKLRETDLKSGNGLL
ncbi:MAG: hypothetical protein P0S93_02945 [Candidatus Neptunochlamydia sp.]|nr:hypothetical protein [Candidatus Neptunochlamydia sp.]